MGTEQAVLSTNLHTGARFYFRSGGERLPCVALTTRGYCDVSESLLSDSGDTEPSDREWRDGSRLTALWSLFIPVVDVLASFLEAVTPERMGGWG